MKTYKIGDMVKILPWDKLEKSACRRSEGGLYFPDKSFFNSYSMKKNIAGKIVKVTCLEYNDTDRYLFLETNGWHISRYFIDNLAVARSRL